MIPRFTGTDYIGWIRSVCTRFTQQDMISLNTNFFLAGKITASEHAAAQRLILHHK